MPAPEAGRERAAAGQGRPEAGRERAARRRRRLGFGFWLAVGWIVLVVAAAATADVLPLPSFSKVLVAPPRAGLSLDHPLGADGLGRDLLSRIIYGSRVSLGIGLGAVALGLAVGGPLGLLAGYYRGKTEAAIMAAVDIALAFPALVFALAVITFVGGSFLTVLVVLGVVGVPTWTRLVRSSVLSIAEREFVLAARALGLRDHTIIWREIVPNVVLPVAAYAFLGMAVAVIAEGGLSFLGLSVNPPTPSWGAMINDARRNLDRAVHPVLAPAAALFLTVLAFNLVGDKLRELTDVRESALRRAPRRRREAGPSGSDQSAAGGVLTTGAAPAVGAGAGAAGGTPDGVGAPALAGTPDGAAGPSPPRSVSSLLEVANLRTHLLTERGKVRAVDGVSFTLDRGRTLGVVGESGSGKTMLVRSILGLLPTSQAERGGRVRFGGRDLSGRWADELRDVLGTQIGAVFQDPGTALNPVRTIGSQVAEPLQVHRGVSRRDALAQAERLLVSVGIPEPGRRMRQYPHHLSGGMRQRVTIAMALACDPLLLLADEPTTALDVTVQDQILRLLHRQREEREMAMVLVSHDLAVVSEWADEVIVMYAGKVVERGPTAALFTHTRMPYTQALLQAIPDLSDESHTRLRIIEGRPPDLTDPPSGCRFHPRCPYAQERCAVEEPPLVEAETPGHAYACWYPVGTQPGGAAPAASPRHGRPRGRPHDRLQGRPRGRPEAGAAVPDIPDAPEAAKGEEGHHGR